MAAIFFKSGNAMKCQMSHLVQLYSVCCRCLTCDVSFPYAGSHLTLKSSSDELTYGNEFSSLDDFQVKWLDAYGNEPSQLKHPHLYQAQNHSRVHEAVSQVAVIRC